MKQNLKNTIIRVTALLLFFAMMAAVILWQAGAYDVSFIKRPVPLPDDTDEGTDTAADTDGDTSADTDFTFATETELDEEDMEAILEMILPLGDALKAGLIFSEEKFSSRSSVARLSLDLGDLGSTFSNRTENKTDTVVYKKSNGFYSTKQVTETVDKPAVSLYFGLIVIDYGDKITVMNKNGKVLIDNFKGTFLYAKTYSGYPAVKDGKKFYYIDYEKGLSKSISESKIKYLPLSFDYPSYYAAERAEGPFPFSATVKEYTETKLPSQTTAAETTAKTTEAESTGGTETTETVTETEKPTETSAPVLKAAVTEAENTTDTGKEEATGTTSASTTSAPVKLPDGVIEMDGKYYTVTEKLRWGYRDADGNTVIEPKYKAAYSFTESGYAAVIDTKDRVCFIDTEGNTAVSLVPNQKIKPKEVNYLAVHQVYLEPYSTGIASIGSYYFDSGYVMTRYQWRATNNVSRISKDENRLIDTTGKEFPLPQGYKLAGYSDGALLLEKDGVYGYMSSSGSWIKPSVYKSASPYLQGLASVQGENGKYGLIDLDGNYVLPMCFDYISNVSGGLAVTYSAERGWEIYCVVASPKPAEETSETDTETAADTYEASDTGSGTTSGTTASQTTAKTTTAPGTTTGAATTPETTASDTESTTAGTEPLTTESHVTGTETEAESVTETTGDS